MGDKPAAVIAGMTARGIESSTAPISYRTVGGSCVCSCKME